jgi:hypothetical protein
VLPESAQDWATRAYLREPIRSYEELLRSPQGGSFTSPWPADLIAFVQRKVYRGMSLVTAWTEIPRGAIVGVVEAVRNRVLTFALELEKILPDIDKITEPTPSIQDRAAHAFHTHIYGNVANIAVASDNAQQTAHVMIAKGNIGMLIEAVRRIGIPDDGVKELEQAVGEDGQAKRAKLGPRVSGWLGTAVGKAASGTWNVALSTASSVLPKLLAKYYGLPD